jgi:magnesium chelatase subunit D
MTAPAVPAMDASVRSRLAAALLALDPAGFGGALVRAPRFDAVDRWLASLRASLAPEAPMSRIPLGIPDDRLLGGLDLAMTLAQGRPVAERGLLARADGGVLVLPCAERASGALVSRLTEVLDTHVAVPRGHQVGTPLPARVAVIALDEGDGEDEAVAAALADRLAFHLVLEPGAFSSDDEDAPLLPRDEIARAATLLPAVSIDDARLTTLVTFAAACGIASLRAAALAVRTARGCAALDGRLSVNDDDCTAAATLVLGPRATQRPVAPEPAAQDEEATPPPPPESDDADGETSEMPSPEEMKELEELLVRAVQATLPVGLTIDAPPRSARAGSASGRAGGDRAGGKRGRQVGTRRGDPRAGGRLDLLETLRAAAPWQRLRPASANDVDRVRVRVRPDDFRLRRLIEPAGTTAIFVVDASGSAALHRMAEAKGAVELLLAEAYSRRDEVGLIAFRGDEAEVLLAPTRAIAAAKRALAALPGGGGTPLASAIDRARDLVAQARRTGNDTIVIFLTDARANIARDGTPGRPLAESDAIASAHALRALGGTTLLIDTSPRPAELAQRMAAAMGARYVALPRCDAQGIHAAVSAAMPAGTA